MVITAAVIAGLALAGLVAFMVGGLSAAVREIHRDRKAAREHKETADA